MLTLGFLAMNPELFETLDNLPADEPRSRLEPFREVILRWRRQGRSYRRIQTLLADHCSLQVSTSMLFKFVESRSRPRKRATEIEYQPAALSLLDPTTAGQTAGTGRTQQALSIGTSQATCLARSSPRQACCRP